MGKARHDKTRKTLLLLSIFLNLSILFVFKYYDFFIENFSRMFVLFGVKINPLYLKIILPVGISFYTFQTMSYSIDVYNNKIQPTRDFVAFAAFVSFFPQLMAGPIERANQFLPQFFNRRNFDYQSAVDGCRQILWGFFKKMVIADNCASYVNQVFNNDVNYSGSTLVLGALFFSFQIYGDFSGYSDIATGLSKLFGFKLMQNFACPYFSRDIAEFWRRWHISLTTWFRDYVYIPLGGNRKGKIRYIRNTLIIFLLSALWHGANWTFIAWGILHVFYFLPLILLKRNKVNVDIVAFGRKIPTLMELLSIAITFSLISFAWIFFRAENISHALAYISKMFSYSILSKPDITILGKFKTITLCLSILFLIIIEWIDRSRDHGLKTLPKNTILRWSVYIFIALLIIELGGSQKEFIYFQF
jgi:D-alanyl-lipoteichoic acid acyltransferase DltB (MBOAT superfamily)